MSGRVVDLVQLVPELAVARARGKRIVLTNGVFDILHVGHLRYLSRARALGDLLVVGVNADAAVTLMKPGRPIVPDAERAELVAALEPVDFAIIFAEPTAENLLRSVRPAVYVKGGDYAESSLPEAAAAREIGAQIVFIPTIPGRSTSALLAKLSQR